MRSRIGVIAAVVFASVTAPDAQAPPTLAESRFSLVVRDGRLSATIDRAPLLQVLEELSIRAQITCLPGPGLDTAHVSAELKDVPVEAGVRQLLKQFDTFLYYGGSGDTPETRLVAVWVYPRGAGGVLRPVPPSEWASTKDLDSALADRDPLVREKAYEALLSRPDAASHNLVLLAIRGASETDADLRQRLLSAAITKGLELPRDMLGDLVRADATEEIRLMALDALAGDAEARAIVTGAANDSSALVRARAREVLLELDSLARRRDPLNR